ncbi:hypothetical protein CHARACLAT_019314 [Characodon lateralis]|uniref:Secreted protein n=1 Tax=Characodon lateralis TaxID=208331 RepID=A0ABU7DCF0_9TELE|nr:hypothetical protein [Characodon lateralis]
MRLRENVTRAIIPPGAGSTLPGSPLCLVCFWLLLSQTTRRSQHPSGQERVFNFSDFCETTSSSIQTPSRRENLFRHLYLSQFCVLSSLSFCFQSQLSFKTGDEKA